METERFHVTNKDELISAPRPQIAYNLVEETNMSICFIQSRMECMPGRVISVKQSDLKVCRKVKLVLYEEIRNGFTEELALDLGLENRVEV